MTQRALEKATWVAKNATQYNFLGDHSAKQRDEVREKYRQEGTAQQARELIGLEGADHRSDNLLEAYQRNPALLTKDDMAELSAYLQVYVHEQTLAGGEQAAQINLNQLLNGSRVPVYGYPYAGLGEDKSAWVDAELGSVGRYLGRDKSTNEKTYDSAKGLLLIDANQRAAAEVGNPALYFLAGPLGGAIRAAAATDGALQFAQGGKQAVEGDSWNAAGNMVMGALGMATVGIPQTVTNVGKGSPATAGSKAPSSALFSPDAEAGMPYSHPVKAVSGPKEVSTKNPNSTSAITDAEAGTTGLPKIGSLKGEPELPPKNASPDMVRSIERQNEAAKSLARGGYDVEQLANTGKKGANPDLRINGELADVASPRTGSVGSVLMTVNDKVKKQASSVVINLADSPLTINQVGNALSLKPVEGLKKLYIMKNGEFKVIEVAK